MPFEGSGYLENPVQKVYEISHFYSKANVMQTVGLTTPSQGTPPHVDPAVTLNKPLA